MLNKLDFIVHVEHSGVLAGRGPWSNTRLEMGTGHLVTKIFLFQSFLTTIIFFHNFYQRSLGDKKTFFFSHNFHQQSKWNRVSWCMELQAKMWFDLISSSVLSQMSPSPKKTSQNINNCVQGPTVDRGLSWTCPQALAQMRSVWLLFSGGGGDVLYLGGGWFGL